MRAAWSAAPQATATANAVADSSVVNGRASYGGLAETSDSPHRLPITREMREVQVQLGLGIQRPSQTTTTPAQAREAAASDGTVRAGRQIASPPAAPPPAGTASPPPREPRRPRPSGAPPASPTAVGAAAQT